MSSSLSSSSSSSSIGTTSRPTNRLKRKQPMVKSRKEKATLWIRRNTPRKCNFKIISLMSSSSSIGATSRPTNRLKRKQPMVKSRKEKAKVAKSYYGICMDKKASSKMYSNAKVCSHLFCSDCIREHVSVKIKENILKVKCPYPKCKGVIRPEHCRSIVPKKVVERWEDALCESLKFYCPFKDCSAMLMDDDSGKVVTSSECPNCNRLFCAQCKVAWHSGMDCKEYKSLNKDERNPDDIKLMKLAKKKKWKRCPSCKIFVERIEGCLHITCRCGYEFCYRCGEEYDFYNDDICRYRD